MKEDAAGKENTLWKGLEKFKGLESEDEKLMG
jgi:hypothetical protein